MIAEELIGGPVDRNSLEQLGSANKQDELSSYFQSIAFNVKIKNQKTGCVLGTTQFLTVTAEIETESVLKRRVSL